LASNHASGQHDTAADNETVERQHVFFFVFDFFYLEISNLVAISSLFANKRTWEGAIRGHSMIIASNSHCNLQQHSKTFDESRTTKNAHRTQKNQKHNQRQTLVQNICIIVCTLNKNSSYYCANNDIYNNNTNRDMNNTFALMQRI